MSESRSTAQSRHDSTETYSKHREPVAQGGRRYLKCPDCGREVVGLDPTRLVHADDCRYAERSDSR
jgi:hypothetical protein